MAGDGESLIPCANPGRCGNAVSSTVPTVAPEATVA